MKLRPVTLILFAAAAFFVLRHLLKVVLLDGARGDFDIVLNAARRFLSHESVYRLGDDSEHTKPPLLMSLVVPLLSVPRQALRIIWDLANLAFPFLILQRLRPIRRGLREMAIWSGVVVLLAPLWYVEAVYGQYNLLILWLALVGMDWVGRGRMREMGAGALFATSMIIKPTQIFLLPWVLMCSRRSQGSTGWLVNGLLGALCWVGVLSGIYISISGAGPGALLADHRDWLQFLPLSAAKHLMRDDNYGIPTLLARSGWGSWISGSMLMVVGLMLTSAVVWSLRSRAELALSATLVLMLGFSPMCWRANFGILVPLAWVLCRQLAEGLAPWLGAAGIAGLFALSRISPYWLGDEGMKQLGLLGVPLGLAVFSLVCGIVAARKPVPS